MDSNGGYMSTVVSFGSNSIIKNSVYKICALQNLKSYGVYGINGYCWSAVSDIVLSLQGKKKRHLYAFWLRPATQYQGMQGGKREWEGGIELKNLGGSVRYIYPSSHLYQGSTSPGLVPLKHHISGSILCTFEIYHSALSTHKFRRSVFNYLPT